MPALGIVGSDYAPEDELDESLLERVAGLGEMFPESVSNGIGTVLTITGKGVKGLYNLSRTYSWIFFSSAAIMFAPVIIQSGLQDFEEMAKAQQRQMLLGANPAAFPR